MQRHWLVYAFVKNYKIFIKNITLSILKIIHHLCLSPLRHDYAFSWEFFSLLYLNHWAVLAIQYILSGLILFLQTYMQHHYLISDYTVPIFSRLYIINTTFDTSIQPVSFFMLSENQIKINRQLFPCGTLPNFYW